MSKFNYNRPPINTRPVAEETTNVVEEVVEDNAETTGVVGVVDNCYKLNVRLCPAITSRVIGTLNRGVEVEIIEDESTKEFYKIIASTGIEGFCMKEYVTIK